MVSPRRRTAGSSQQGTRPARCACFLLSGFAFPSRLLHVLFALHPLTQLRRQRCGLPAPPGHAPASCRVGLAAGQPAMLLLRPRCRSRWLGRCCGYASASNRSTLRPLCAPRPLWSQLSGSQVTEEVEALLSAMPPADLPTVSIKTILARLGERCAPTDSCLRPRRRCALFVALVSRLPAWLCVATFGCQGGQARACKPCAGQRMNPANVSRRPAQCPARHLPLLGRRVSFLAQCLAALRSMFSRRACPPSAPPWCPAAEEKHGFSFKSRKAEVKAVAQVRACACVWPHAAVCRCVCTCPWRGPDPWPPYVAARPSSASISVSVFVSQSPFLVEQPRRICCLVQF